MKILKFQPHVSEKHRFFILKAKVMSFLSIDEWYTHLLTAMSMYLNSFKKMEIVI